jgi:glycine hydroxymethyltransferase
MTATPIAHNRIEVHDRDALAAASAILDACAEARDMGEAVKAAVARNAQWRGEDCINLLAPEAPTSPGVRALLGAEIGTRAAEGHIGKVTLARVTLMRSRPSVWS